MSMTIFGVFSVAYVPLRTNQGKSVVKDRQMGKDPAAVSLGRKGGKARARNLTPEQRKEAARRAVEARWEKTRKLAKEINERSKRLLKAAEASARKKRSDTA